MNAMPLVDWYLNLAQHLGAALLAGGLIGLERSFQGRAAGFRTHTLVCLSSSVLMLITVYQSEWFPNSDLVQLDPTRMAQGIMTGIGFLGAGVIMRDGLAVRGLTTAASIWITAGIGILAGVGLYGATLVSTVLAIGVLAVFRWLERVLPIERYTRVIVRFATDDAQAEVRLLESIDALGLAYVRARSGVDRAERRREIELTVKSRRGASQQRLSVALEAMPGVERFEVMAIGE